MNSKVVRLIVLVLLVGMFTFFAYSLVSKAKHTDVGDQAYNFKLQNINGGYTQLSDFKGKMIVLNYYATWCQPCKDEAPELEAFGKDYGSKYKLIMINRGETIDHAKSFFKQLNPAVAYVFDYDANIAKIYNVTGQPETFVIDKQGMIREHFNGPLTEMQLYNLVKKHDN